MRRVLGLGLRSVPPSLRRLSIGTPVRLGGAEWGCGGWQCGGTTSVGRLMSTAPTAVSSRDCKVEYTHGSLQLTMPLPKEGLDDVLVFYFAPGDSVASMMAAIRSEDPELANATVVLPPSPTSPEAGADGVTLDEVAQRAMSVSSLCSNPFELRYGSLAFTVSPSTYLGGAYGIDDVEANLNLRSLLQKGAFARARKRLDRIVKPHIQLSEYLAICADVGVPEDEARQLLRDLHRVGIVLNFADEPSLKNTVFLDPEDVVDVTFDQIGLKSPKTLALADLREKRLVELGSMEQALAEKRATQLLVEQQSSWFARQFNTLVGLGITGGSFLYLYITYVELSWDIMEPVTYFTATAVTTVGYWWWLFTEKEFEYSNMYDVILNWRRRRKYKTLTALQAEGSSELQRGVLPITAAGADADADSDDEAESLGPVAPPPDANLSGEMAAINSRIDALRWELRQLGPEK